MSKNIKSEMKRGKSQKQAVAIAYSVARKAKKAAKKKWSLWRFTGSVSNSLHEIQTIFQLLKKQHDKWL